MSIVETIPSKVYIESKSCICLPSQSSFVSIPQFYKYDNVLAIKELNTKTQEPWIVGFVSSLQSSPDYPNVKIIDNVSQVEALLAWFYNDPQHEKIPQDEFILHGEKYFPYLHYMNSFSQQLFYCGEDKLARPQLKNLTKLDFNLIFLNSGNDVSLINTIDESDLLTKKPDGSYHPLDYFLASSVDKNKISSRNYKHQIKLMAPYSNLFIYGNNHIELTDRLAPLTSNQLVFMVKCDISPLQQFLAHNQTITDLPLVSNSINKSCQDSLLEQEHQLIWRLHDYHWLYDDKVCLTNVHHFETIDKTQFKLIIQCHEEALLPSLASLEAIFLDLNNKTERTHNYLEFPASGYIRPQDLTQANVLSILNLLKLVCLLIINNDKVLLFSYDGFTGFSMFLIALDSMLKKATIEDSILNLVDDNVKLYFFKSDYIVLHQLNQVFPQEIDYQMETTIGACRITPHNYDWFKFNQDNNFPSKILPELYLGSYEHSNSFSILNFLQIEHLVSIGTLPDWLFGMTDDLQPIFSFNNSKIYEIFIDNKNLPTVKSIIFIEDFKDDGKDSMLPLLIECPSHIQSKIFHTNKTLVHCRIGVSRSASLVIARIMKQYSLDLLSAYMFVRVQRFNIIIQPNLRLLFDLYLFDKYLGKNKLTWEVLCFEIYKLNRHYIGK